MASIANDKNNESTSEETNDMVKLIVTKLNEKYKILRGEEQA